MARDRLSLLKTLGDNTRYAIYLELARSPRPLGTAEVAATLGLHVNTVRPHLERMREVGLLEVRPDPRSGVGRPQHLYSPAADAPGLGLEPPVFPMLASMLLRLAAEHGISGEAAADLGRDQGEVLAGRQPEAPDACLSATMRVLDELGFDPTDVDDDDGVTVAFTHCPFAELAESSPEIICSLHRGMVEGFVDHLGGARVGAFHDLSHRAPCRVQLVTT